MKSSQTPTPGAVSLADLRRGEAGVVCALATLRVHDEDGGATLLARLRDLGFVSGARCEVIARMWPVGDPLAVRIGGSTFALRRAEAAAVQVTRVGAEQAGSVPPGRAANSAAIA